MLVCDQCGSQHQVYLDEKQADNNCFSIAIVVEDMANAIKGVTYGVKYKNFTFCDRDCMIEFFKNNMNPNGKFREKPDEVKRNS
jgi:hypothetical protein